MPRISQQHWFCLAALFLVGSLVTFWSFDIEVEQQAETDVRARPSVVFRSLEELPASATISDDAMPLTTPQANVKLGTVFRETILQAPAAVSGRMASPLNSTGRMITRERIVPADFENVPDSQPEIQQVDHAAQPSPVWLSGQIEISDGVR